MHFLLLMSHVSVLYEESASAQQESGWPGYSVPPGLKDTWYRDVFIFFVPTWYRSTPVRGKTYIVEKDLYFLINAVFPKFMENVSKCTAPLQP